MAKTTYTALLPTGEVASKTSTRPITHVVGTIHPERGYSTFRWSAAPETAVKELQRKGWSLSEIFVNPVHNPVEYF